MGIASLSDPLSPLFLNLESRGEIASRLKKILGVAGWLSSGKGRPHPYLHLFLC
jgi:hypothetical protein